MAALGDEAGFEVEVAPPFTLDGRPVRSTDIRTAIAAGDLAGARALLGRAVAVVGEASPAGAGEGRSRVSFALPVALPPDGSYRVGVAVAGRRPIRAGGDLGRRPHARPAARRPRPHHASRSTGQPGSLTVVRQVRRQR